MTQCYKLNGKRDKDKNFKNLTNQELKLGDLRAEMTNTIVFADLQFKTQTTSSPANLPEASIFHFPLQPSWSNFPLKSPVPLPITATQEPNFLSFSILHPPFPRAVNRSTKLIYCEQAVIFPHAVPVQIAILISRPKSHLLFIAISALCLEKCLTWCPSSPRLCDDQLGNICAIRYCVWLWRKHSLKPTPENTECN